MEIKNLLKQNKRMVTDFKDRVTQLEKTIQNVMVIISILSQKGLITDAEIEEEFAILVNKDQDPEKAERKYLGSRKHVNGGEPDNKTGPEVSDDKNPRVIDASQQFKRKEADTSTDESDN